MSVKENFFKSINNALLGVDFSQINNIQNIISKIKNLYIYLVMVQAQQ